MTSIIHLRSLTAESVSLHHFCAEASDLGWAPGHWPTNITLRGYPVPIELTLQARSADGTHTYASGHGAVRLRVFND